MHKPEMFSYGSMSLTLEGLKEDKSVLFSHKLGQHVHQKSALKCRHNNTPWYLIFLFFYSSITTWYLDNEVQSLPEGAK